MFIDFHESLTFWRARTSRLTLHYITWTYITLHYITWRDMNLHYITVHDLTWTYITLHCITLVFVVLEVLFRNLKTTSQILLPMLHGSAFSWGVSISTDSHRHFRDNIHFMFAPPLGGACTIFIFFWHSSNTTKKLLFWNIGGCRFKLQHFSFFWHVPVESACFVLLC